MGKEDLLHQVVIMFVRHALMCVLVPVLNNVVIALMRIVKEQPFPLMEPFYNFFLEG
jgi:hypothetical protein